MSTRTGLRSFEIAAFAVLLGVLPALGADPGQRPGLPVGASADWWNRVEHSIQLEEYGIASEGAAGVRFRAANPAHRFEAVFDAGGVHLAPTAASDWEWRLTLTGWGRPEGLEAVGATILRADQDRVEIDRGPLTEWFVNSPQGLEHGFTVPARPEAEGDRLVFDLAIAGGLRPVFAKDGQAIDFYSTGSISVLRYGKLAVTDARGGDVPARMEPIVGGVRIVVDDSDAIYPLTVDPLATSPSWSAAGEGIDNLFGHSVSSAGDVNKDGYSDVIVGANHASSYAGKAYLYLGGPSGLSATASWTQLGEASGNEFGAAVATAGDVNKDGYSDVVIGAPKYSNNTIGGKAYLYLGGASGLSATPSWTAVGEGANATFGWAVGRAGDVNGDGYSDVIIGAFGNASATGKAYLYRGGASGLSTTPSWTAVGEAPSSRFGRSVATAGDVNRDGYSDVLVSAPDWDNDPTTALFFGKAYLYLGGSSGLSANPAATAIGQARDNYYGCSVGTAGDVNGDGYSDIVVGAYANNFGIGKAYVYLGRSAAATMLATASWNVAGNTLGANTFGWSVGTAGDVNGDGFSDVVISSGLSLAEGKSHLFLGGASGLATTPSWTTVGDTVTSGSNGYGQSVGMAGDVNGDGYSDVLIGDDQTNYSSGKAYVFLGGPNVAGIGFSSNKTAITWNGTCSPSLYDVVRGVISDLPNFSLATCMENDSPDASTLDLSSPPVGSGYYYLASCDAPKVWNDGTQSGTRTITPCP